MRKLDRYFVLLMYLIGAFVSLGECRFGTTKNNYCLLPMQKGPCEADMTRYYYNTASKRCEMFSYGGCDGNENNFGSMDECLDNCVLACDQPLAKGSCAGLTLRYYYNADKKKCESFLYSKCRGNDNNFESLEACQRKCTNICLLPALKGPCNSLKERYYFDKILGKCTIFTYGGCEGNLNNFEFLRDCQKSCRDMNSHCLEPEKRGEKIEYIVRWMYNIMKKTCLPFIYGGKDGNNNNFETFKECMGKCPNDEICKMDMDSGPCDSTLERWHYDYIERECKEFTYGGCLGNGNNFESKMDCEKKCKEEKEVSICTLPSDRGPCTDWKPRFYYDQDLGKCNLMVYGGCKGNKNNFLSVADCEARCPEGEGEMDICQLAKDIGDGGKIKDRDVKPMSRYYYDSKLEQCRFFQYSGSGGNANNFRSSYECQLHCPKRSRCTEPLMGGSGSNSESRWYFDIDVLECKSFYYKGFGGNKNNFDTKRDCQNICLQCNKKLDTGPCHGFNARWGFDVETRQCKRFIYGGCRGNANRFKTPTECEKKCE